LVERAQSIAKEDDAVSLTVFNREALKKYGFGGILGIAQGSAEDPYFIHLVYTPKAGAKALKTSEKIGIVGKGVTFDTGGLSLKPAKHMETMKVDMAGAAALLGVFKVFKEVKPSLEIHGFIATCDNMPFTNAVKPGDVITAYNGKTIEVANTDAEGRIILADALAYACEQKMDVIIDIATLTGACLYALGSEIGGLFSNDDALAQEMLFAGEIAGEDHCRIPLYEYYKESITKNTIADIKNISTMPEAGAITAALFLQEFVTIKKWAHIDIGGSAYHEQSRTPYIPSGATGNPVRTLLHFLHLHGTKMDSL
jgi:leucyl aminopeptidase